MSRLVRQQATHDEGASHLALERISTPVRIPRGAPDGLSSSVETIVARRGLQTSNEDYRRLSATERQKHRLIMLTTESDGHPKMQPPLSRDTSEGGRIESSVWRSAHFVGLQFSHLPLAAVHAATIPSRRSNHHVEHRVTPSSVQAIPRKRERAGGKSTARLMPSCLKRGRQVELTILVRRRRDWQRGDLGTNC
jgi:hypothetical protein